MRMCLYVNRLHAAFIYGNKNIILGFMNVRFDTSAYYYPGFIFNPRFMSSVKCEARQPRIPFIWGFRMT